MNIEAVIIFQSCRTHEHKILIEGQAEQKQKLDFPTNDLRQYEASQFPTNPRSEILYDQVKCTEWKILFLKEVFIFNF